jgi:hypothetical protein
MIGISFKYIINPKTQNIFMKENRKTDNFNFHKWGKLAYLDKIIFNVGIWELMFMHN